MRLNYVEKIKANISIESSKKTTNLLEGLYRSIFKGRSMDFDDLRDYVIGDNSKDIDWKSSIRHGSLLVRRYIALKKHNIAFIIDCNTKMSGLNPNKEEKKETILYTYGTLAYIANKNEDEICTVYSEDNIINMSKFISGLPALELSVSKLSNYITKESKYTINDLIELLLKRTKRKLIIVVISDLDGLTSLKDEVVKKAIISHDMLFINIDDMSLLSEDAYDLDERKDVPGFIIKNSKLKELESKEKDKIKKENFKRLEKYRVSSVCISCKKEIVPKLIDLLERHNHAVVR